MNRYGKFSRNIVLLLSIGLLLSACMRFPGQRSTEEEIQLIPGEPSAQNGEKIYFTSISQRDGQIPVTGGPSLGGGTMMGSYLTCASCHGPEARGGQHAMHMQIMYAPDIRYAALASEAEEHAEEDGMEPAGEYDLEMFRMAVVEGKHPDGDPLNDQMPRWEMSDDDLADLLEFLKTIP